MGQDQAYYRAMLARDARFDGKFFVGVKTTGIYCRPVCPARPKRRNVEFFPDARAAENAGYRPSLRCRPEAAPDSAAWNGSSALVQRALRALAESGHESVGEGAFARLFRFGSGPAGLLRVSLGTDAKLRLQVRGGDVADLGRAARAVRRMFDLDADPAEVASAFAGAPGLDRLLRLQPGLRAP